LEDVGAVDIISGVFGGLCLDDDKFIHKLCALLLVSLLLFAWIDIGLLFY
jgi:hypothetical protein